MKEVVPACPATLLATEEKEPFERFVLRSRKYVRLLKLCQLTATPDKSFVGESSRSAEEEFVGSVPAIHSYQLLIESPSASA